MAKRKTVTRKFEGGGMEGELTYSTEFGFTISAKSGSRTAYFLDALAKAATEAVTVAQEKA